MLNIRYFFLLHFLYFMYLGSASNFQEIFHIPAELILIKFLYGFAYIFVADFVAH